MRQLLRFAHGWGDAVQWTIVLRHLQALRPDVRYDMAAPAGCESLFHGLVERAFALGDPALDLAAYQGVLDVPFPEPQTVYADSPSTKAERALREQFGIAPRVDWCRYQIQPRPEVVARATRCLAARLGPLEGDRRYPIVLLHYQGNSCRRQKNLDERIAAALCRSIRDAGCEPWLLDWSGRSRLPQTQGVFNAATLPGLWPDPQHGDGATLAALIAQVRLFVGIDSGPGHIAGATATPAIIVWRRHHPLHFYGLSSNVTHLASDDHPRWLRGDREQGLAFFHQHYAQREYSDLERALTSLVGEKLSAMPWQMEHDLWVRPEHAAADRSIIREVYAQDVYRLAELPHREWRYVVDIGAHLGAFACRVRRMQPRATIVCVEPHPDNVRLLQANVGPWGAIEAAACTYAAGPQRLLSTVHAESQNTGASRLTGGDNWAWDDTFYRDAGLTPTLTLEDLCRCHRLPRIDLLKLDCEGSELSILDQADLSQVRAIVGEYHGREAFQQLLQRRFADWRVRWLDDQPGEVGLFWLLPPRTITDISSPAEPSRRDPQQFDMCWRQCAACDQLQGTRCTMTGHDARRAARLQSGRCPMDRWPRPDRATSPLPFGEPHDAAGSALRAFLAGPTEGRSLLLRFPHGLGDHVQWTAWLQAVRTRHPRLHIDVACRVGAEGLFRDLARRTYGLLDEPTGHDLVATLPWREPEETFAESASTKIERSLRETIAWTPREGALRYAIPRDAAATARVAAYVERIEAAGRVLLIHARGRCGARLKNLDPAIVRAVVSAARQAGAVPVLLDWDRRQGLFQERLAENPAADDALWERPGNGDAATLAALARAARLCLGIDSGPGHLFSGVDAPALLVWKLLHPVNYLLPMARTTHWVPRGHGRFIRGDRTLGEGYFRDHYQHHVYHDLAAELPAAVVAAWQRIHHA